MFKVEPEMTGLDFDAVSRKPLRAHGLDFKHGLAHGVGHVLGVHEGPNTIRRVPNPMKFKAGMIMSNEPEPLTCVPYDRAAINTSLLSDEELAWVNNYHAWVRETLVPLLDEDTAQFVIRETEPLSR